MRGRLGRATIVATLLGTLLLPAAGSLADSESKLDKIKDRLGAVRERIEQRESNEDDLEGRIRRLNGDMVALRQKLAELDARIVEVEAEVRSAQARIDETQAKIDRIEQRATSQAVALYKAGATETIDALLDAKSVSELDARAEILGVAAKESTGALIQYGRLRVTIEDQHAELFAKKEELGAIRAEQAKSLATMRELHEQLAADLAELEERLGRDYAQEGDLEDAAASLTARIRAETARRAVENLGTSAQGFIWPLNGAITSYFGPRWGRMHTGVDIDGVSGQPVVASKAGRVIMASYYSGYGNTVIIDHGGGIQTLYAHMSGFGVSNGQSVSQGQIVGNVGCTGSCTGDHLHFEVRVNGSPVDPLDYLP